MPRLPDIPGWDIFAAISGIVFLIIIIIILARIFLFHGDGAHTNDEEPATVNMRAYSARHAHLAEPTETLACVIDDEQECPLHQIIHAPSMVELMAGFTPWTMLIDSGILAIPHWLPQYRNLCCTDSCEPDCQFCYDWKVKVSA